MNCTVCGHPMKPGVVVPACHRTRECRAVRRRHYYEQERDHVVRHEKEDRQTRIRNCTTDELWNIAMTAIPRRLELIVEDRDAKDYLEAIALFGVVMEELRGRMGLPPVKLAV